MLIRIRYLLSVLLHRVLMFRCNLSTLRSTVTFMTFTLPLFLARLLSLHRQHPPPPLLSPTWEAVVLSTFPLVWFYGFLYYTEVPSLVSVLGTIVFSMQDQHCIAAVVCDHSYVNKSGTVHKAGADSLALQVVSSVKRTLSGFYMPFVRVS